MSDTPSDPAGQEEPEAYVPTGMRRSTFTPPPADAVYPIFDDDALAAALEEEVRTYTSPITLPTFAQSAPGPVAAAEPTGVGLPPDGRAPVEPEAPEPEPEPEPVPVPEPVADDELLRSLAGASTLDAMQRLEDELRRRATSTGPVPIVSTPPFFAGEPPVSPPAPGPDPETPLDQEVAPEPWSAPGAEAPTPESDPEPDPEPEPDAVAAPDDEPEPWEAAPPPVYVPPPLVEPPGTGQMRLLPPPTDLPDIAQRAELPPPPGYEPDGTERTADTSPTPVIAEASIAEEASAGEASAEIAEEAPAAPAVDAPSDDPGLPTPEPFAAPVADEAGWSTFVPPAGTPVAPGAPVDADPPAPEEASVAAVSTTEPEPAPAPTTVDATEPEPRLPRALVVETAGLEPTRRELRAGRAARLFWLWFAVNSSVVSMALGAGLLGMGMSLRQAIVATLAGIALSFIPLGFGTLAGKRTGQPTMVVSRASFGHIGNLVPTALALVARVFWGAVLLWLLADSVARVLVGGHADAGLGETVWGLIAVLVGFVIAALVAIVGYGLFARVQLVLSIVSALLIVGAAALTFGHVHLETALTHQDGPWIVVAGGAAVVFAFIGVAWSHAGSDVARYQRGGASGGSMLWATFGATLPPFVLVAWGALLAASNPTMATGLATHPIATIASLLPSWYPAPLLLAAAVGLLSGSVLNLYSGGFAVQTLVPRLPRPAGVLIAALLVLATGATLVLLSVDTRSVIRDLAVTLAVPVAAWIGVFAGELMLRSRLHTPSLLARGGVYPSVRWTNLVGLVVISVLGYGFVASGIAWLGWEGYGLRLLGVAAGDPLAAGQLGVVGALVLGILLPIATALPTIRREEAALGTGPVPARS